MQTMKIRISEDLEFNAEDFLESAIGIIGKRGGGKSGGVKVVMEELVKVGLPFVAFDPVGIMWGIKSSLDGKAEGLPVLVIGGSHGDLKLERRAGAQVATAIVQANISCIIDFSEEPKAAYREFVKDFCHKLFAINDTSRLVILEEASELVPQRLRPDMAEVFESVERLVSRGRNKGIGVIMVSQRAATINKDVLTQVDALIIFGLTSPQDRKALTEWVEAWGQKGRLKEFEDGLAGLQRQEAWFWAPTLFKQGGLFQKIRIRNFKTFHPDKTHLRRSGLLEQKPVTTDVSKIITKLGAQLERFSKEKVEAASIPKLQARIRQLETQITQLEKGLEAAKSRQSTAALSSRDFKAKVDEARQPLHEQIRDLKADQNLLLKGAKHHVLILRKLKQVIMEATDLDAASAAFERKHVSAYAPKHASADAPKCKGSSPLIQSRPVVRSVSPKPSVREGERHLLTSIEVRRHPSTSKEVKRPLSAPGDVDGSPGPDTGLHLTKAHLRIIGALAKLHGIGIVKPSKTQVALWSDYSPTSGGYANYLGQLRSADLIEYGGHGTMFLTNEGKHLVESMEDSPEIPSTVEDLREQVFRMVGESRTRILKILIDADREPISKPELAEQAGFSPTSGGYANYLGNMRSMGLINYVSGGVVATEVLFP